MRKFDSINNFVITPKVYEIILPDNVVMDNKVESAKDKSQDSKGSKIEVSTEVETDKDEQANI